MRLILFFLSILAFQFSFSQDKVVYFSDAIKSNIKKYNTQSDKAFEQGDIAAGQALFDSLVQNKLVGSKFDDYVFKSVNSRKVKLSKIKKPVFIITYSSWCLIGKGEVQALNKLARKFDDQIQFIAVFWDTKHDTRKVSRKFSNKIKVCYANETYKNDARIVSTLKHTLGFPTSYYLNNNLEVIDIKRGGIQLPPHTSAKTAFDMNYRLFNERISIFLEKQHAAASQLASVTD